MAEFKCVQCKRASRYVAPDMALLLEGEDAPEPRNYKCEHCGKVNEISKRPSEWKEIDRKR
jgi:hypothetical protein